MENICLVIFGCVAKEGQFCRRCNMIFSQNFEQKWPTCVITSVIRFSLYDRWRAQSELHRSYLEAFVSLRNALLRISKLSH